MIVTRSARGVLCEIASENIVHRTRCANFEKLDGSDDRMLPCSMESNFFFKGVEKRRRRREIIRKETTSYINVGDSDTAASRFYPTHGQVESEMLVEV